MGLNTKPRGLEIPDAAFERVEKKAADTAMKPREGIWKGNKRAISHTIAPELLDRVDAVAQERGQTRTSVINTAIFEYLKMTSS